MTRPLILLDLDGTLVDSRHDIAAAIREALREAGAPAPEATELFRFIGKPLLDIFVELLDDREPPYTRAEAACETYRRYYFDHCADRSTLYPGVRETLLALRPHAALAIATTKRTFMAERVAELLGLAPLLDAVGGTDGIPFKPDPALLLALMRRFDADPARTLMVGDTVSDLRAARKAGVSAAAVLYGIGSEEALRAEAPDLCLARFPELLAWVERVW